MYLEKLVINNQKYLNFVQNHKKSTIFHHPLWLKTISKTYNYNSFILTLKKDNIILATCPFAFVKGLKYKKYISFPFSDHCSILHSDKIYKLNFTNIIESIFLDKSLGIEFRNFDKSVSKKLKSKFVLHLLKLDLETDKIFKRFSSSNKRAIRKAKKENLRLILSSDYYSIEIFYKLHQINRKRFGIPIQPKRFFFNLYKYLFKNNMGKTFIVYKDNIPISAGIFFFYKDQITYKFGASNTKYWDLRPNNLLFWEVIKYGCKKGYRSLDFGKTNINNEGLLRFKRGWGTDEYPLNYIHYPEKSDVKGKRKIEQYSKFIIQNSPVLVTRLSGELFYKYFA